MHRLPKLLLIDNRENEMFTIGTTLISSEEIDSIVDNTITLNKDLRFDSLSGQGKPKPIRILRQNC